MHSLFLHAFLTPQSTFFVQSGRTWILCSVGMSCVLSWKCSYSERKTRQCFGSQSVVTLRIQSHKACSRSQQCTPWSDLICSQSHCSDLTMDDIHTFSHRQVSNNRSLTYLHINSQRNATLRLFYTVIVFQQSVHYMHKVCVIHVVRVTQ